MLENIHELRQSSELVLK